MPFSQWMRTGWNQVARDVLLDRRSRERGIIDPPAVERLLRSHAAGSADDGDRIWSLLNLELWYRTFIDNEGVQTLPERHRSAAVPQTEIDMLNRVCAAGLAVVITYGGGWPIAGAGTNQRSTGVLSACWRSRTRLVA